MSFNLDLYFNEHARSIRFYLKYFYTNPIRLYNRLLLTYKQEVTFTYDGELIDIELIYLDYLKWKVTRS